MSDFSSDVAENIYREIRELPEFPIDDEEAWKNTAKAIAESGLTLDDVANLAVDAATADMSLISLVTDSAKRQRFIKALSLMHTMKGVTANGKGASMSHTVELTAQQTLEYFARAGRGEGESFGQILLSSAEKGSLLAQGCAAYLIPILYKEENQALAAKYFEKSIPWIRSQALCGNMYAMTFLGFHYAYSKCLTDEDKHRLFDTLKQVVEFGIYTSHNGFIKTAAEGISDAASDFAKKATTEVFALFKKK